MPYLSIYGRQFQKANVIIVIAPSNLNKFHVETKIKFGSKIALFGCFWAAILKQYCHI